jgi:hypothetical protein
VPASVSFDAKAITVVANLYTGCNAGRREAEVFSQTASAFAQHDDVLFLTSLKVVAPVDFNTSFDV